MGIKAIFDAATNIWSDKYRKISSKTLPRSEVAMEKGDCEEDYGRTSKEEEFLAGGSGSVSGKVLYEDGWMGDDLSIDNSCNIIEAYSKGNIYHPHEKKNTHTHGLCFSLEPHPEAKEKAAE